MAVVLQHRVRYHEADAQGFMFNSRFLEVADVAMTEYFRSLGYPYLDLVAQGTDPSVLRASIHYMRPARFEDVMDVAVRCTHVGRSSFHLDIDFVIGSEQVAKVQSVYVNVDAEAAKAVPLPDSVADALRSSLGTESTSERDNT